jgi:hypothetical protein
MFVHVNKSELKIGIKTKIVQVNITEKITLLKALVKHKQKERKFHKIILRD